MIFGTSVPTTIADIAHNLALAHKPLIDQVAATAVGPGSGDLRVSTYHSQVFTDDLAPVERLIDQITFPYATGH
jgi:hypothetical protein